MAWDEAMKYDTDDLPGRERREQAARYYQQGKLFPYDGPAVGAGDWAIRAARGVLAALKHKRLVLDGYEEAQRVETVQLLAEIIRHAASENGITE